MKHLTIRGIPDKLARALERETRRRGQSLNQTVKELLERALGVEGAEPYDNGLSDLAGKWSQRDFDEFTEATKPFEKIDEELWR